MSKIIGVTVGTPTSPEKIENEIKPVKTVNGNAPDENGNVEVVGNNGDAGKSAYEYAKDGGYTGTEAEFAIKMAQKIPSKTSDLTNDSGFIKASEAPIQSVNNKTGEVTLSATDVGARPSTWTPTYADVGADKSGEAESRVSVHNTSPDSHNDIRLLIQGLSDRINAVLDSDDTTLDELSEIVTYIKANKALIDSITTSKVNVADIVNNLTTNVTNKPLSAAQGVVLKALIDALDTDKLDASALTDAINTALAQAKTSGEFDGKDGTNGKDGEKGADGTSVTVKSVSESTADGGSNFVIFSDGKTITIKNGSKGSDGKDGKTPVKGTDYFTPADKTEMVNAVIAQLPKYTGEVI